MKSFKNEFISFEIKKIKSFLLLLFLKGGIILLLSLINNLEGVFILLNFYLFINSFSDSSSFS